MSIFTFYESYCHLTPKLVKIIQIKFSLIIGYIKHILDQQIQRRYKARFCIVANYINSTSVVMTSDTRKQKDHDEIPQSELRRSSRARKEPKNDDYFMGSNYIDDIFGHNNYDDQCYPKRRRRNYRYDDSDDYSEGHKYSKKSKLINSNKVEGLLEWRFRLELLPISVLPFLQGDIIPSVEQLHRIKTTKHLASQNISAFAEDIEAMFINIDWGKKGQSLKDFQQLKIDSHKLMSKGLVFVWAPKNSISELLTIMEKKQFVYIENFEIINFDIEKVKQIIWSQRYPSKAFGSKTDKESRTQDEELDFRTMVKSLEHINPCDIIAEQTSEYFNRSKRTLLMFKKNTNLKFELRHQRTCDVVFDLPQRAGEKCSSDLKSYIYNMIETLLPDCLVVQQRRKRQYQYKMLELWADKGQERRGWISVIQE